MSEPDHVRWRGNMPRGDFFLHAISRVQGRINACTGIGLLLLLLLLQRGPIILGCPSLPAVYARKQWGPPKPGDNQVRLFQGVPHMYCSKSHEGTPCGWNPDHSTNYHNAAKTTPNWNIKILAKMSPNHPLVLAVKNSGRPPPGGNTGNTGNTGNNNDTPPDHSDSGGAAFNSL